MSKETGGPAFPIQGYTLMPNGETVWPDGGMTLRDYFAAKALSALTDQEKAAPDCSMVACWAYQIADAMIAERDK